MQMTIASRGAEITPTIREHIQARLHAALMVLHAPGDAIVAIENAIQIFLAAQHPKSFVTLADAAPLIPRA